GADDAIGRKRRLDVLGLEALVEISAHALSHDLDEVNDVGVAEAQGFESQATERQQVAQLAVDNVGRRPQQQSFDPLGQPRQLPFVIWITFGVALRKLRQLLLRGRHVLPEEEVAAIGKGREKGGVFRVEVKAEARQLKLVDDLRLQQAAQV